MLLSLVLRNNGLLSSGEVLTMSRGRQGPDCLKRVRDKMQHSRSLIPLSTSCTVHGGPWPPSG
jgi:hypothetical protein